jgi:hypothetical protein
MAKKKSNDVDVLKPQISLLIKLGSLITHYEEYNSYDGHSLDKVAIDSLTNDREVKEWLSGMNKLAFLPQKRNIKT